MIKRYKTNIVQKQTLHTETDSKFWILFCGNKYEGWNFNSGNYLFTTDTI